MKCIIVYLYAWYILGPKNMLEGTKIHKNSNSYVLSQREIIWQHMKFEGLLICCSFLPGVSTYNCAYTFQFGA